MCRIGGYCVHGSLLCTMLLLLLLFGLDYLVGSCVCWHNVHPLRRTVCRMRVKECMRRIESGGVRWLVHLHWALFPRNRQLCLPIHFAWLMHAIEGTKKVLTFLTRSGVATELHSRAAAIKLNCEKWNRLCMCMSFAKWKIRVNFYWDFQYTIIHRV